MNTGDKDISLLDLWKEMRKANTNAVLNANWTENPTTLAKHILDSSFIYGYGFVEFHLDDDEQTIVRGDVASELCCTLCFERNTACEKMPAIAWE